MVCHLARVSFIALALFLTTAGSAAAQPQNAGKALHVRIVIQTAPGVYNAVIVPANTVVSVLPLGPQIIRCPGTPGLAFLTTTADCFEYGLASGTIIKLTAPTSLVPNATFFTWTDIPGTSGLPISNFCIYTASSLPPTNMPNLQCSMAGSRFIQAVYKCNDTYTYDAVTKQCKKIVPATLCQKFTPSVTACRAAIQVKRKTVGTNTYKVTVAPAALTPSLNNLPSNSASCVNAGSSLLQTHCGYAFNSNPTAVTLTASSWSGTTPVALPVGFFWSGACTYPTNQNASGPVCLLTIVPNAGNTNSAVANFP